MSLTGNHHLYAALHENGANDFMAAIYAQRGHYFHYGSSQYVPQTTVHQTNRPKVVGLHWKASFSLPRIDFHPVPPGSPMTVATNQFLVRSQLFLKVLGAPTIPPLEVRALGVPVANAPNMSFQIVQTNLLPNLPPPWGPFFNALATLALNGALANFLLPYPVFPLGAFVAIIGNGPSVQNNQLEFQGNL
jgi:hypothetical protein